MSGAPSPTVNTKEAMRLVMGMFNASLELDKAAQPEDEPMNELQQPPQAPHAPGILLRIQLLIEFLLVLITN